MRTVILALTLVLTLGVGVASAQSIEGVWKLAEYEGENVRPADPVGLMIVADGNYSRVFVRSEQPRQPVGNSPTPEQQFESWQPFVANSGTYTFDGSTLTFRVEVAEWEGYVVGASRRHQEPGRDVRCVSATIWGRVPGCFG